MIRFPKTCIVINPNYPFCFEPVKLACFSDPHSDIQMKRGYPKFLDKLYYYLNELDFDVLLVTGDVAGSTKGIEEFFSALTLRNKIQLFVPGNHDIWVNPNSRDGSWIKYYHVLSEMCKQHSWHFLPKNPTIIDGIGFAGSIGWYDYSTRNFQWDDRFSPDDYAIKIHPETGAVWMDREFIRFGYDDQRVAQHFTADLLEDISWILNKEYLTGFDKIPEVASKLMDQVRTGAIDKLVVGTHIVPFKTMVFHTNDTKWDFFSAFIGNQSLGEMIIQISNLVDIISISGHTHFPQSFDLPGLQAYGVPLGYPHEWKKHHKSLGEMFENRIKVYNL